MSDHKERWRAMKLAGASRLNESRWRQLVDEAIAGLEKRRASWSFIDPAPASTWRSQRHVAVEEGDAVIPAQMVIDLELALVEAQQLEAEIRELAAEDLSESRRARLLAALERCREAVRRNLKQRGEA